MSVILSHPVSSSLLQCPREIHTQPHTREQGSSPCTHLGMLPYAETTYSTKMNWVALLVSPKPECPAKPVSLVSPELSTGMKPDTYNPDERCAKYSALSPTLHCTRGCSLSPDSAVRVSGLGEV